MAMMNERDNKILELYLSVAEFDNDFKPMSDRDIAQKVGVGKSTVERVRKKYNFQEILESKINLSIATDKKSQAIVARSATDSIVQKTVDSLARNAELVDDCYAILKTFTSEVISDMNNGRKVSDNKIKLAKDILQIATGREDKILDRQTQLASAEIISKADILDRFNTIEVEVEQD
jgi:hypothetical protein